MSSKSFILQLAKLLIALAWADGKLSADEINALKDLIYSLPEIDQDDWTTLSIYMDSPVTDSERTDILNGLLEILTTGADKYLALEHLTRLVTSDGSLSDEEQQVLSTVQNAIEQKNTSILGAATTLMKGMLIKRDQTYRSGSQREALLDDFIKNTVYYQLIQTENRTAIDLPDEKLKKLCLAAGLMARVAWVDQDIEDTEKDMIRVVLEKNWSLSRQEAQILADISCERAMKGLDRFRLTRSFFEATNDAERTRFLKCLFAIANASGNTSHEEIEEIRTIATTLKVPHKAFIEAKLTIPREDRKGL